MNANTILGYVVLFLVTLLLVLEGHPWIAIGLGVGIANVLVGRIDD